RSWKPSSARNASGSSAARSAGCSSSSARSSECSWPAIPACCSASATSPSGATRGRSAGCSWPPGSASPPPPWACLPRRRRPTTEAKLHRADRYFIVLELLLLLVFFVGLGAIGASFLQARWLILWALVLAGTLVPLALLRSAYSGRAAVLASCLVLVGGLALRIVVLFGAPPSYPPPPPP